jgi:signal transduction histidine kinase
MSEDAPPGIPVERYPGPALAYRLTDGEPRVTAGNDEATELVSNVDRGSPLGEFFEVFDVVVTTDGTDPEDHLRRGNQTNIYLDGFQEHGPFIARIVPPDSGCGWLLLSDLSDRPENPDAVGVGQVASVISHDLRNPLDVATAHLRAARETGDSEHFDAVANAHDRMGQIIRDVLTLARGTSTVAPTTQVDIERAVRDAWRSVETDYATMRVADPLPTVTADPDRLRRALENLFRNSVEHGPTDGPPDQNGHSSRSEVEVTVGMIENGFYVADDGSGIAEDEQETVFKPGYSSEDGGTGLGLAIVEKIVSAHGWTLSLTTAENGGARFEIEFPRDQNR